MPRRGRGGETGRARGSRAAFTHDGCLDPWQGNGPLGLSIQSTGPASLQNSVGFSVKPHLSLSEVAGNTERNQAWSSDLRLRHSRITFINAGVSKPEELTQIPQEPPQDERQDLRDRTNAIGDGLAEAPKQYSADPIPAMAPEIPISKLSLSRVCAVNPCTDYTTTVGSLKERSSLQEKPSSNTFTDVSGSNKPIFTGLPPPTLLRPPSPATSDSSEEVILFAGRKASHKQAKENCNSPHHSVIQPPPEPKKLTSKSTHTVIDDPIAINLDGAASVPGTSPQRLTFAAHRADFPSLSIKAREPEHRKDRRGISKEHTNRAESGAEIIADYIANTGGSEEFRRFAAGSALNSRDLSDLSHQWQGNEGPFAGKRVDCAGIQADEWDSSKLQDFDELSTSSEALNAIERILSKRERVSGVQYLVVSEGYTTDDARWLPINLLNFSGADEKIRLFEEEQAKLERLFEGSESSEDSLTMEEKVAMHPHDDLDDFEDDGGVERGGKDRMTDEQIARLLSKQEELGLGSNDLLLFDGQVFDYTIDDTALDRSWRLLQTQATTKRKKRHQNAFPNATSFADVLRQDPYNGFDVTDQERPSLRIRSKGRRGKVSFGLSDSELEHSMANAWENDRTKKKLRKQEREELRIQGFLSKNDKIDLRAKYTEGMSMDEVIREIWNFLSSSMESLPLPPMAHKERKTIHEVANVCRLKSKSVGAGKSRFPVLYKTVRTVQCNEKVWKTIEATMTSKHFLPRLDKAKKRGTPTSRARGGLASASVSYRDGEVVGATAPELGQENRGRAMLEKMGWSTGTALGALNNTRGIVQPVTQIVKTGKAGLG